ncbi:hypothetical protein TL16_g12727 [Triparma laevis f. inornata]|uniref:Uncharacterized protein n=1 Tax=Triparma laevis f. inornata TaxID=1714386 RepID=A0A9W7BUG9_9STRA|nr:hypothetical protein TL16_g12727 [Triparma laevis f. inornata]
MQYSPTLALLPLLLLLLLPPISSFTPPSFTPSTPTTHLHSLKNEIDFCLSPSDTSLSSTPTLTSTLNIFTNAAIRRITLSRTWPTTSTLNTLLLEDDTKANSKKTSKCPVKCPVPRSILNILTRKRPSPLKRSTLLSTPQQLKSFESLHDEGMPGWKEARDYLVCVCSLCNESVESERIEEVREADIYWESYLKVLNVLETAGAHLTDSNGLRTLSPRLVDSDICLSVLDKFRLESQVEKDEEEEILGSFLMSSLSGTMTEQLNVLSNVVRRSLLFGSDLELTILSETLSAQKITYSEKWYPEISRSEIEEIESVKYLNALIGLCDKAVNGGVTSLEPSIDLSSSYGNSYSRLMGGLIKLGSGYVRVEGGERRGGLPKTPTEELGRFVKWESEFRKMKTKNCDPYPKDLCGTWTVTDEVGGRRIGVSQVTLKVRNCEELNDDLGMLQLWSQFVCAGCFSPNALAAFIAT